MNRLLFLAAAVSTACGNIECDETTFVCDGDDRPATLEYVTMTILKPNCAPAQCHSAFSYVKEYRFDTVEHAQESLVSETNGVLVIPGDAAGSFLFQVLTRPSDFDADAPRMPYDQPLQAPDIALIKRWIDDEGADGLVIP
jgi:hypothetical protein